MYAKEQANQNANFSNINARIGAEQSIGLRQAKLADINNQPPNLNGMGKDVIFSYGYDYGDIYVIKKEIKKEYRERLENYFGTKVNITNKNNKVKIEIEYYSEEDLQRILEIINL